MHVSSTYLRLISANEAVFAVDCQIYLETSSLQRENVPKLPGVLRLLLQKADDIGAFLSSLLLKE